MVDVIRSTAWDDPVDSMAVSDLHLDITNTTSDLGAWKTQTYTRKTNEIMLIYICANWFIKNIYFEYCQRFPVFDSFHTLSIYRQYTVAFPDTSVLIRWTSSQHFIHLKEAEQQQIGTVHILYYTHKNFIEIAYLWKTAVVDFICWCTRVLLHESVNRQELVYVRKDREGMGVRRHRCCVKCSTVTICHRQITNYYNILSAFKFSQSRDTYLFDVYMSTTTCAQPIG